MEGTTRGSQNQRRQNAPRRQSVQPRNPRSSAFAEPNHNVQQNRPAEPNHNVAPAGSVQQNRPAQPIHTAGPAPASQQYTNQPQPQRPLGFFQSTRQEQQRHLQQLQLSLQNLPEEFRTRYTPNINSNIDPSQINIQEEWEMLNRLVRNVEAFWNSNPVSDRANILSQLIDRSTLIERALETTQGDLEKKEIVKDFIETLQCNRIFIAFNYEMIRRTQLQTQQNYNFGLALSLSQQYRNDSQLQQPQQIGFFQLTRQEQQRYLQEHQMGLQNSPEEFRTRYTPNIDSNINPSQINIQEKWEELKLLVQNFETYWTYYSLSDRVNMLSGLIDKSSLIEGALETTQGDLEKKEIVKDLIEILQCKRIFDADMIRQIELLREMTTSSTNLRNVSIQTLLNGDSSRFSYPVSFYEVVVRNCIINQNRVDDIVDVFRKIGEVDKERKARGENAKYNSTEIDNLKKLQVKLANEVKKYSKTDAEVLYSFMSSEARPILQIFNNVPNKNAGWDGDLSKNIILESLKKKYPDIQRKNSFTVKTPETLIETLSTAWTNIEAKIPAETNWNDKKNEEPLFQNNKISPNADKIISTYHISDVIGALEDAEQISNITLTEKLNNRLNDLFGELPSEIAEELIEDFDFEKKFNKENSVIMKSIQFDKLEEILYNRGFANLDFDDQYDKKVKEIANSNKDEDLKVAMIASGIRNYMEKRYEEIKAQENKPDYLGIRFSSKVSGTEKLFNTALTALKISSPEEISAFTNKVFSDSITKENKVAKETKARVLKSKEKQQVLQK